jgi:2-polyprenyl-3-methyl-5-hydroxy-6-metoxy-1,4-benzoquinol methylase
VVKASHPLTIDPAASTAGDLPLREVPCYLCGSQEGEVLVREAPFTVKRCARCTLAYVTPRVPESHLHLIYQTDYFKSSNASDFGYSDYTRDRVGYLKTFRAKARLVQRHKASGSVLEVGSAAGFFLFAMRELGYETMGVEVSPYVVDFARRELGLENVHQGFLKDAPTKAAHYDVVAMWDVIEHLSDPIAELRRIRTLIKPDGRLFLQTQDIETWFAKLLGAKWQHFKHLEHIHHFSPRTIKAVLERAGFEIVHLTHTGAGKYISVEFFVDRMRRYSALAHHLLRPLRLFGRSFFYLNPGDEMIVVAKPV